MQYIEILDGVKCTPDMIDISAPFSTWFFNDFEMHISAIVFIRTCQKIGHWGPSKTELNTEDNSHSGYCKFDGLVTRGWIFESPYHPDTFYPAHGFIEEVFKLRPATPPTTIESSQVDYQSQTNKCTCGVGSLRDGGLHSSWCNKE